MIIRGGKIYDAVKKKPYEADIRIVDGKIEKIAKNIKEQNGEKVLNAEGLNVYPGLVDAHSHMGLDNYGMGYEGQDYNEYGDIIACHLRAIDGFNPLELGVRKALEGGVTTVGTGPGSANVLGGTFMAVKTYGNCVDDMVVKEAVAMKCAFGENPKRCYKEKGNSSRMSTASKLREMLFKASDYMARKDMALVDPSKKPPFDMKLEALIPVLRGDIPLKAHAHRADDICTAIRIAKEFGVRLTIEHCTEGHLIVKELQRAGWPVAVGPTLGGASKIELVNKSFTTPGILSKAGLKVSIITDSPVIPEEYLSLCAGLAVKAGMDEFEALKAITINPAEHLGIADRVGSLEPGKDADIILVKGNVMESSSVVKKVLVNGELVINQ